MNSMIGMEHESDEDEVFGTSSWLLSDEAV